MTRRVPWRRTQSHFTRDAVIDFDEAVEASCYDRFDVVTQVDFEIVVGLPVLVFDTTKQVLRVRKGGNPCVVHQHGVPTDVIEVQMCAHNNVDVAPSSASVREIIEKRSLQRLHVLVRKIAIVAKACIDK